MLESYDSTTALRSNGQQAKDRWDRIRVYLRDREGSSAIATI